MSIAGIIGVNGENLCIAVDPFLVKVYALGEMSINLFDWHVKSDVAVVLAKEIVPAEVNVYVLNPPDTDTVGEPVTLVAAENVDEYCITTAPATPAPATAPALPAVPRNALALSPGVINVPAVNVPVVMNEGLRYPEPPPPPPMVFDSAYPPADPPQYPPPPWPP